MKTIILLHGGPLITSLEVDELGYILQHKLVYSLDEGDLFILKSALALTDEVSVCSLGATPPTQAFLFALLHGAQDAYYFGAQDWPKQPLAAAAAYTLQWGLKQNFDLLITGDYGEEVIWAAQAATNMGIPFFNSLISVEEEGNELRLLRKLAKGQRQEILAKPPLVLAILPQLSYAAAPAISEQVKVNEKPIFDNFISYYDCLRRMGIMNTPTWMPQPLKPAAQESYKHLSDLSADDNLNYLLHGPATTRAGLRISDSVQKCAEAIIDYMLQAGLILKKPAE
ncbi:MAG: hypothetical protein FWG61_09690 [Firmicutes bacterium]|nr:hypothetical protein [Bacillota bacterium]